MTTITLHGLRLDYTDDTLTSVNRSESSVIVGSAASTFNYNVVDIDDLPIVEINSDAVQAVIEGQLLEDLEAAVPLDVLLGSASWPGGVTTVMVLTWNVGNQWTDLIYVLGGAPLPDITTVAEWNAFDDSIDGVGQATVPFAPGVNIRWTEFDNHTVTEDDEFRGTPDDDEYHGGIGDDYFQSTDGVDYYYGDDGVDQVSFAFDPSGVTANLGNGVATDGWGKFTSLHDIEILRGSRFNDTLIGDGDRNHVRGLAGDDVLNGAKGRDVVRYDRDERYGGTGGATVNLKTGKARDGFGDTDTLRNFEDIVGTESRDQLTGSGGKNLILGLGGNDRINGLAGRDNIDGGDGKDIVNGGGGNDSLTGGGQADRFVFSGTFGDDTITDFATAGRYEKIDLGAVRSIRSFRDLKNNHLSEDGGDAVIDDGKGNTITLDGVAMADLSANDFLF